MSLTKEDLEQIRTIMREELEVTGRQIAREESRSIISAELQPVKDSLQRLEGEVEALGNDVKEIYEMLIPTNSDLNIKLKDHEVRITALETA